MKLYLKIIVAIVALTTGLAANSQAVTSHTKLQSNMVFRHCDWNVDAEAASRRVVEGSNLIKPELLQQNTNCYQNIQKKTFLLTQAQVKPQPVAVSVALPKLANVSLKGGESRSGRVTAIDPSGQTLSMQRSDKTVSIPLKQIEKVVFRNDATVYRSNGQQIIRGERDRPQGQQVIWNSLPLSTFIIKNANQGLAVVNLEPPVVSPERLVGIQSVAKDRQYVVDEMQFDLQQKTISIRATPY